MNAEAVIRHIDLSEVKPSIAAYYWRYVTTRLVTAVRTYDDLNDDVCDVPMCTRPQMKKYTTGSNAISVTAGYIKCACASESVRALRYRTVSACCVDN
jgi:hypothetical protein